MSETVTRTAPSLQATSTSNAERAWVTALAAISEATRHASDTSRSSRSRPCAAAHSAIPPAPRRRAPPAAGPPDCLRSGDEDAGLHVARGLEIRARRIRLGSHDLAV